MKTTHSIPFEGKYIIYRPLLHIAFLGNQAMADRALRFTGAGRHRAAAQDHDAYEFLDRIGFLQPDPPVPIPDQNGYKPKTAVLLMTNRCNLRCTYCYAAAGEKRPEDMPLDLAKQAVDIVASNAQKEGAPSFDLVFHGGGEPTQHWNVISRTIEYARSKPIPCTVSASSNGVWSKKQRDYLLGSMSGITLSFDGIRTVQNSQRPTAGGKGSFGAVMKTIREMNKSKFPYNIRITWTPRWSHTLAKSVRFICNETGCRQIQVEPAFNSGRTGWTNPQSREADLFIEAFKKSLGVAKEYKANLMYAGARPWMTVCTFCTAAESALVVRADGTLVACYEVTDSRHPLAEFFTIGRLGSDGPVMNEKAVQRLSSMRQERLSFCGDCFCKWHCGGDCSTRCFSEDGAGHLRFDQRCRINREITKEMLAHYIEYSGGIWRGVIPYESQFEQIDPYCKDCKLKTSKSCQPEQHQFQIC